MKIKKFSNNKNKKNDEFYEKKRGKRIEHFHM